nr:hypothetical protein [Candidatus Sigynarchaeota archaeon]
MLALPLYIILIVFGFSAAFIIGYVYRYQLKFSEKKPIKTRRGGTLKAMLARIDSDDEKTAFIEKQQKTMEIIAETKKKISDKVPEQVSGEMTKKYLAMDSTQEKKVMKDAEKYLKIYASAEPVTEEQRQQDLQDLLKAAETLEKMESETPVVDVEERFSNVGYGLWMDTVSQGIRKIIKDTNIRKHGILQVEKLMSFLPRRRFDVKDIRNALQLLKKAKEIVDIIELSSNILVIAFTQEAVNLTISEKVLLAAIADEFEVTRQKIKNIFNWEDDFLNATIAKLQALNIINVKGDKLSADGLFTPKDKADLEQKKSVQQPKSPPVVQIPTGTSEMPKEPQKPAAAPSTSPSGQARAPSVPPAPKVPPIPAKSTSGTLAPSPMPIPAVKAPPAAPVPKPVALPPKPAGSPQLKPASPAPSPPSAPVLPGKGVPAMKTIPAIPAKQPTSSPAVDAPKSATGSPVAPTTPAPKSVPLQTPSIPSKPSLPKVSAIPSKPGAAKLTPVSLPKVGVPLKVSKQPAPDLPPQDTHLEGHSPPMKGLVQVGHATPINETQRRLDIDDLMNAMAELEEESTFSSGKDNLDIFNKEGTKVNSEELISSTKVTTSASPGDVPSPEVALLAEKILAVYEKQEILNGGLMQFAKLKKLLREETGGDFQETKFMATLEVVKSMGMISRILDVPGSEEKIVLFKDITLDPDEMKVTQYAMGKPVNQLTKSSIATVLGLDEAGVLSVLKKMQDKGILRFTGKDAIQIP